MKHLFSKILAFSFLLILLNVNTAAGQNFYSKPEATRNLSDAAKYLKSTLPELEESNQNMFKVNSEKLRFISSLLRELKSTSTVEEAANSVLPKEQLNVLQPVVRFIDTSFAGVHRNKYIRDEILFLVTY